MTFHYIFPQLTMGTALLIVVLKALALARQNRLQRRRRFWMRIFAVNFALESLRAFPWNFSSARTGPHFRRPQEE